jgi:O-antigen/teichoic acid export membrane protein
MDKQQIISDQKKNHRDIIKGAFVNLTGIIAKSMNFVFFVVLGRLYGPEITGLYLLSWTTVDIISKTSILGLDRTVMSIAAKDLAVKKEKRFYRTIANALLIGLTASTVTFILTELSAGIIASVFLKKEALELPVRIMGLGLFFWTLSAVFIAASRSLRIMKYEIIVKSIAEPLIILIASVILYKNNFGVTALAISFVLSTFAGSATAFYLFTRRFSLEKLKNALFSHRSGWRKLLFLSSPTGIYDLLNLLLQRTDLFILTYFATASTAGIYGIATEVAFTIKKVRQSFDPIFIPVVSELLKQQKIREIEVHFKNITRWIFTIDFFILSVFIIAGEFILSIFGNQFTPGFSAMIIIAISVLINGSFGVSELFILIEKPWLNIINTAGTILVSVTLNVLLVPDYGMSGAALSIAVSYFLMNCVRMIEVFVMYKISPFSVELVRTFVTGVISLSIALIFKVLLTEILYADFVLLFIFSAMFLLLLFLLEASPEVTSFYKNIQRKKNE